MIRNWYNQIPYPALKTKREIIQYINWQQFTKGTRGKPNEQLFPRQVIIQLPKYVTHIICEPKYEWATSWQNQQNECAPSEDSDQPGHPPSLIRVFAVRMKKAWVLSYPLSAQRRLIRLGGCPGWSESSLGAQPHCWFCHEAAQIRTARTSNSWRSILFNVFEKGYTAYNTVKLLKLQTPEKFALMTLKFEQAALNVMRPKDADGMANNVDPD